MNTIFKKLFQSTEVGTNAGAGSQLAVRDMNYPRAINYLPRQGGTGIQLIQNPVYTVAQKRQLAVVLAAVIGSSLDKFEVKEQYGRCYFISFLPLMGNDPKLPFIFRDYGREYKRGYKTLTDMMSVAQRYRSMWDYDGAMTAAEKLITAVGADSDITDSEFVYYRERLLYAIASPAEHWVE